MGNLGPRVTMAMLAGNEDSAEAMQDAIGKEIKSLELTETALLFTFADGKGLSLYDDGQSCCEERYMHSDDAIQDFVGAKLLSAETREAPSIECEYGDHEVQFLVVTTDRGAFTIETHNEHNGYYGGFVIRARAYREED